MNEHTATFIKWMRHPIRSRLFLFFKLPIAYLAGVRIREADARHCVTTVPYKWLTQNPFRSTYFACLSMAAELSTGSLAMAQLYKRQPKVSMLVIKVESEYFKKATGHTIFVCEDGELMQKAVEEAIATGESRVVRARSTGTNKNGELIARFFVTWSFRAKR